MASLPETITTSAEITVIISTTIRTSPLTKEIGFSITPDAESVRETREALEELAAWAEKHNKVVEIKC